MSRPTRTTCGTVDGIYLLVPLVSKETLTFGVATRSPKVMVMPWWLLCFTNHDDHDEVEPKRAKRTQDWLQLVDLPELPEIALQTNSIH